MGLATLGACSGFSSEEASGADAAAGTDSAVLEDTTPSSDGGTAMDALADAPAIVVDANPANKHVFVTRGTHDGKFDSLSAADDFCRREAGDAGAWRAWLSTAVVDATDYVGFSGTVWHAMNDAQIFGSTGPYYAEIPIVGFDGQPVTDEGGASYAWTGGGTKGTAAADEHCGNWTTNVVTEGGVGGGRAGRADGTGTDWASDPTGGVRISCSRALHIFCFEQ